MNDTHNNAHKIKQCISEGNTSLGFELGSTRIKAVLIDDGYTPIAGGEHTWENKLVNGIWTYSLEDVWTGLQESFRMLRADVRSRYGLELSRVGSVGVSAMMHGYLVFNSEDELLVPFRTWRNTMTEKAAACLTDEFGFNIPQRWSIAHLYQAVLNNESHVGDISFLTTLAGYVHWRLSGEKVLGVGDASGVFPIDSSANDYNSSMLDKFSALIQDKGYSWDIAGILPRVLCAGEFAGRLTQEGARLLSPGGELESGAVCCPPEGDAGTGMVATNSVARLTGNVSAGTSIFAMLVLEKELEKVHTEIDMVTTPSGRPVAMVHCNNCSSDIDAWVRLLAEAAGVFGNAPDKNTLYETLYSKALSGDKD